MCSSTGLEDLITCPSDDDEPIIEVETDAQNLPSQEAYSQSDSRYNNGNNGGSNQLVSNALGLGARGGRRR